jgi:hypothetical protein
MSEENRSSSNERQVTFLGGAAIDGAPVSFIVVMAALVTALSFVPLSVVMGSGGSFPLSQAILPLVGVLLGPIAGAVASGIGALAGVFLAPHTAGIPPVTIIGAMFASFTAGSFIRVIQGRRNWWIPVSVITILVWILVSYRALVTNGVPINIFLLFSLMQISAMLLYVLPTRILISKWLSSTSPVWLSVGMFLITWVSDGLMLILSGGVTYLLFSWPAEVFAMLIPMVPLEHALRSFAGTVIGVGVVLGLRAIGVVKPKQALY